MGEEVKYQLRLTLSDPFAEVARNHPDDPSIASLQKDGGQSRMPRHDRSSSWSATTLVCATSSNALS